MVLPTTAAGATSTAGSSGPQSESSQPTPKASPTGLAGTPSTLTSAAAKPAAAPRLWDLLWRRDLMGAEMCGIWCGCMVDPLTVEKPGPRNDTPSAATSTAALSTRQAPLLNTADDGGGVGGVGAGTPSALPAAATGSDEAAPTEPPSPGPASPGRDAAAPIPSVLNVAASLGSLGAAAALSPTTRTGGPVPRSSTASAAGGDTGGAGNASEGSSALSPTGHSPTRAAPRVSSSGGTHADAQAPVTAANNAGESAESGIHRATQPPALFTDAEEEDAPVVPPAPSHRAGPGEGGFTNDSPQAGGSASLPLPAASEDDVAPRRHSSHRRVVSNVDAASGAMATLAGITPTARVSDGQPSTVVEGSSSAESSDGADGRDDSDPRDSSASSAAATVASAVGLLPAMAAPSGVTGTGSSSNAEPDGAAVHPGAERASAGAGSGSAEGDSHRSIVAPPTAADYESGAAIRLIGPGVPPPLLRAPGHGVLHSRHRSAGSPRPAPAAAAPTLGARGRGHPPGVRGAHPFHDGRGRGYGSFRGERDPARRTSSGSAPTSRSDEGSGSGTS